ncbi:hypothetical protein QCA50_008811 [Cerrena zonata]|uniref:Cytochrome P450 n=1 Tax=Cerrena zonata TaxID=2478898 RepID=A0AAW0GCE5_9APHY
MEDYHCLAFLVVLLILRFRLPKKHVYAVPSADAPIPWIGTILELYKDGVTFLRKSRERYGPVYTLTVGHQRVTVATHKEGVMRIMKDKSLENNINIWLFESLGGVESGTITRQIFRLLSTSVLRSFSARGITQLAPLYSDCVIHETTSFINAHKGERISLIEFVSFTIYRAVSVALFGPKFPLDTQLDLQCIIYYFPRLLTPRMFLPRTPVEARARVISALDSFIKENWNQKNGFPGAADAGNDLLRTLRSAHLTSQTELAILFAFIIGLHINTLRVTCWFFALLIHHPTALIAVRDEVDRLIDEEHSGSLNSLLSSPSKAVGKNSLPFLDSALNEVLRLCVLPVLVRQASSDIHLALDGDRSVVLKEGQYIVADGHVLNMAEDVFEDPERFKFDRFTKYDDRQGIPTPPLVSAFGSGPNICKGQDFAIYEMKVLVIVCLRMYDFTGETLTGNKLPSCCPKASTTLPTPVKYLEEDVYLRFNERIHPT